MNIYIFDSVEKLTSSYHEGGGLVVIAETIDQAVELAQADGVTFLRSDEIENVIIHKLAKKTDPKVFVFPDAGCC